MSLINRSYTISDLKYRAIDFSGEWVFGWYLKYPFGESGEFVDAIMSESDTFRGRRSFHKIYFNTLGLYTLYKDVNDREIYTGDIIEDLSDSNKYYVEFARVNSVGYVGFVLVSIESDEHIAFGMSKSEQYRIIGNIYENGSKEST